MNPSINRKMLFIKALDNDATVKFSEYTKQWYVSSNIEIGDGCMLSGATEHRDEPDEAVEAFFESLTSIGLDKYIVTSYRGKRREWRWNGATFAECTRQLVLDKQ